MVHWDNGEIVCADEGLRNLLLLADRSRIEVCATPHGPCWPADLQIDYVALLMVVQALDEPRRDECRNPGAGGPRRAGPAELAPSPARAPTPALSYQEMLRTLGTLLDHCGSEHANIVLSPQGAEVIAATWRWQRDWTIEQIRGASTTQRGWRSRRGAPRRHPAGLRWRLRLVGAELDLVGASSYVVSLRPDAVRVQSHDGFERRIDLASLQQRAALAPTLRGGALAPGGPTG